MVAPAIAAAGIGALADLGGGLVDQYFNEKASDKAWKRQKKVLQNQVQWRVADAVAAGLHPLAALGLSPANGPAATVGSSLGSALSGMGQNLGRAAEAYLTPTDKASGRMALLAEERAKLENDLIRSQIAGAQKALLTQGSTPGLASSIPELPPGALYGSRDTGPNMNQRLQNRHGEMADVLTAPQSVLEVLSQPGNMADPALSRDFFKNLASYFERGGSFNRRSPRRYSGGGGW